MIILETIRKTIKIKESKSFEGWDFLEWVKHNIKDLKAFVKLGVSLTCSLTLFYGLINIGELQTISEIINILLMIVSTFVGKGLLDNVEYFFKKVEKVR